MALVSVYLTIPSLVSVGVILLFVKKLYELFKQWRVDKMLEKWEKSPNDKVILHSIWRGKTIPSPSPFALKLETYLRMAKIPFELESKDMMGPKGKLPWITYNGTHVADSHLAIQFLNNKLSINLNKNATEKQVAIASTCRIMLEERCFFGLIQYRAIDHFESFSKVLRLPTIFKYLIKMNVHFAKGKLENIGIGKHTPEEIYEMTEEDLRTVSKLLGNKKFIGGDEPCEEDCGIFGMVAQAVWGLPGSSFERLVNGELSNLKKYCERMKNLYWPDWDSILDKRP